MDAIIGYRVKKSLRRYEKYQHGWIFFIAP